MFNYSIDSNLSADFIESAIAQSLSLKRNNLKKNLVSQHQFNLDNLYYLFEQNQVAVNELLEVILIDFTLSKSELRKAIKQENVKLYESTYYKMIATLNLLQATPLKRLLEIGKARLSLGDNCATDVLFSQLEKTFDKFLLSLNTVINESN